MVPRWLALALAAVVLLAAPAAALEVHVEVGLDDLTVEGGWTPVLVRCRLAPGEAPLAGRVVLERPRDAVAGYAAPLRLEPGGDALVRLAAPCAPGAGWQVRVEDGAGRTLAEVQPDRPPTTLGADERLVVLVGRGAYLASEARGERLKLARVDPAELPRDPRALAPAAVIAIKTGRDPDAGDLARDPAAVAALDAFVRGGGRLVLLAGDRPVWRDTPLDALLPARCDGAPAAEPGWAVTQALGRVRGELPLLAAEPRPGARVVAEGSRWPLVVERDHGRGLVRLCLVDVDREAVRGAERGAAFFLAQLQPGEPPPPRPRPADVHDLARAGFLGAPPVGVGAVWLLSAAALVHALAISVLATWAARRRGPWAGLLVPPVASLALAALLLAGGAAARGPGQAAALVVVSRDDPARGASVQVELGLLAGDRDRYEVDVPPGLAPLATARRGLDAMALRAPPAGLRFDGGRPVAVGPLHVPAHGLGHLGFEGWVPGEEGPLLAGAPRLLVTTGSGQGAWPRVEVRSLDERALDGLLVVALAQGGARARRLPPLAPGGVAMWDPSDGRGEPLSRPPARDWADVWGAAGAPLDPVRRDALLAAVGALIEAAWSREGLAPPPPPTAWVLAADAPGPAPLGVRDEAGRAVAPALVRVTCAGPRSGP